MRVVFLISLLCVLAACAEEPPPRSVQEFLDNSILLEAAMVRCSANRVESRYEAECVNAREAVKIIAAREEEERRARMEALSEQKRRALRRTLDAAAEARKRAEEERRLREEAEYLAQFGELPPSSAEAGDAAGPEPAANAPTAIVPPPQSPAEGTSEGTAETPQAATETETPAESAAPRELSDIREELRKRQQNEQ